MRFDVLTLFPEMFESYFATSILKRAQEEGKITIKFHNIRDYSTDPHKKVDDTPYGGGAGMLMTCQPLFDCIEAVKKENKGKIIFLTPQGEKLTQPKVESFAESSEDLILLCGRYEGIDQRVRDNLIDEELSVGDYILTGGELPAMLVIDAVSRIIPGVLGHEESAQEDSFSEKLNRKKEYPQYTKPADFRGYTVPEILRSGNHAEIDNWRKNQCK